MTVLRKTDEWCVSRTRNYRWFHLWHYLFFLAFFVNMAVAFSGEWTAMLGKRIAVKYEGHGWCRHHPWSLRHLWEEQVYLFFYF